MDTDRLHLRAPDGARATVLLHGGQLISWVPAEGVEQLYLSPTSRAAPGQALRGGVPVIFPQFAAQGSGPRHGLARTRAWQCVQHTPGVHDVLAVLRLEDDADTRALWPHAFALELTVRLGGRMLEMELAVENRGDSDFNFQAALHSYWRVGQVREAVVQGLQGARYEDAHLGEGVQHSHALELLGQRAINRVVHDVGGTLRLSELGGKRQLALALEGFSDIVLWNPGPAHGLDDLPADDWQHFVCLEAAQIGRRVHLAPGEEWVARQTAAAD